MYAITGITGKVGGAVARTLLAAGRRYARSYAMPLGHVRGLIAGVKW